MSIDRSTGEITDAYSDNGLPEGTAAAIRIDDVVIGHRVRRDLGDLTDLMDSIREHGVLQPVGVMPDKTLLHGGRRLEACRRLGRETVPYIITRTRDDALSMLRAERDENTCRKDMTPEELIDMTTAIEQMAKADNAKVRNERLKRGEERPFSSGEENGKPDRSGWTNGVVADAIGMSRASYERTKDVVQTARDESAPELVREEAKSALADLNTGKASVSGAAERVRRARKSSIRKGQGGNVAESRQQRADKIRDFAGRGYSTRQMLEMVGIGQRAIKIIAKDFGIEIPADKVIGKTKRHDSNRIVDNVVDELASLYLSLELIDYTHLDQERAEHWANSLDESFKILTRFRKQIKEMTQ